MPRHLFEEIMQLGPFNIYWLKEEKTVQIYLHTRLSTCEHSYTDDRWMDKFKHVMILLDKSIKTNRLLGIEAIISY
jgi:hypothetical protein